MRAIQVKISLLICYIIFSSNISATNFNPHFWTGHQLHGALGFIATEIGHSTPALYTEKTKPADIVGTKVKIMGSAAFLFGYEYGYQFAEHWFVSGGLEWSIAYPRNFLFMEKFKNPKKPVNEADARNKLLFAWLQPFTHIRMGYVFNNNALLTLGLTYLWGLDLDFKIPLNDHVFIKLNYLQWLDDVLNLKALSPTFGAGFDFANVSVGIGYKF
jgi:hypothetical protein